MKVAAFTPSRLNSQRVPQKNIRPLGGVPLVNYAMRAMSNVPLIDETVIFASEPSICGYIEGGISYRYLQRPASLDTQTAKVQDLIGEFLKLHDARIVVMFHLTSPFLRPATIADCVEKVVRGEHDSAFTAFEVSGKCWFDGMPLNHDVSDPLERITGAVVVEHSLYVFRREVFEKTGQRISNRPYVKVIDHFEGHDIDTPEDFRIAELILSTGRFIE